MDKNHENFTADELTALEELEKELKDAYKHVIRNSLVKEYEADKDKTESYTDPDAELNNLETLDELRDYALNYCMDDLMEIPGTEDIEITEDNIEEAENLFDAAVHDWYLKEYVYLENTDGQIAEEQIEGEQYEPQQYTEEDVPEFDIASQPVPEEDNKANEKKAKHENLFNARRHYIIEHLEDYLSVRADTSTIDYDASNSLSLLGGKMSEVYDETALEWYADEVFEARCAYVLDGDGDLSEEKLAKYIEENEKAIPDERAWELYHDKYLIPMREQQKEAEEAEKIRAAQEAERKNLADEQSRKELDAKLDKEQEKINKEIASREALAEKRKKLKEAALKRAEEIKKAKSEIKDAPSHRRTAEEIAAERAEAEKLERFLEENEVRYQKIRPDNEKLRGIRSKHDELQKNAGTGAAVRTASVKGKPQDMKTARNEHGEIRKNASKAENIHENIDAAKYNAALRELAGSLNDTGSIFSWDSKEFTNMKKYLNAVSGTDLSEKQLGQAFNAIREGVKAYEEHAKADPRPDNKRRNDRLNVMGSLVKLADCFDNKVKCPKEMFKLSADNMVIDILCKNIKNGYTKKQIEEKVARSESYSKYMGGLSLCEMHKISKDPKEAKNAIVSIHNIAVKTKENKANAAEESKNPDENVFNL